EALELIGDPESNLLVQGPHPQNAKRQVYHWFEMCDAVQNEVYEIDHVPVSNFILPLYFTSSNERGGRNDFLRTRTGKGKDRKTLMSFGVNPGGYVGFFDPEEGTNVTYFAKNDRVAARRAQLKRRLRTGRGTMRRERTSDVTPAAARRRARTS